MSVGLRDPEHRVSPRTRWVWAAAGLVRASVGAGLLVLVSGPWYWFGMPWWAWVIYAVVAVGYVVLMPLVRYHVHRWETTESAVYTQSGWLTRERRVAPMSRVQTVDLEQGPVERLFGLAKVTVTTASAAGPVRIDGLDKALAERMVAELTRRTEVVPGDAT